MNKIINSYLDFEFSNLECNYRNDIMEILWFDLDGHYVFQLMNWAMNDPMYVCAGIFDRIQGMLGINKENTLNIINIWIQNNLKVVHKELHKGCY